MQFEEPPLSNNKGWKREVLIFTSRGTEKVRIAVWETNDDRPIEIFIQASKSNTLVDQFLRDMGKNLSRLLQAGVPVAVLVKKLEGEVGPLGGETNCMDAPAVTGIQDLISKVLTQRYVK